MYLFIIVFAVWIGLCY